MKKRVAMLFLILLAATVFSGCGKKKKTEVTPTPVPSASLMPTPETVKKNSHDGQVRSKLTGQWVKKETGNTRPFAIMINNIQYASRYHSGISQAGILYEAVVEGGITRLMGLFENPTSDIIGSVRSARHYYVSFADEYDAIFVHYGQTKYAVSKINELGIDTLSGLSGEGTTVFYRQHSIRPPHNAFTGKDGLDKGVKRKKYRTTYRKDYKGHFKFNKKNEEPEQGKDAQKVKINFSNYTSPFFEYDKDKKIYKRFQFGGPHMDHKTGKQLTFKNIILQYVKEWDIDRNGYQTMDIANASGKGYYITNGKAVEITWKKSESQKEMKYYNKEGKELSINPGRTYIGIVPQDRKNGVVISNSVNK